MRYAERLRRAHTRSHYRIGLVFNAVQRVAKVICHAAGVVFILTAVQFIGIFAKWW